jgi:RimJ/RimL family protein N-acetyltransferase
MKWRFAQRLSDASAIASICGDPEVCAWDAIPWTRDEEALGAWIAFQDVNSDRRIALAITAAGEDTALGWVAAWPEGEAAELGYWIVPEARRRGLTLAAARIAVQWAFATPGSVALAPLAAPRAGRLSTRRHGCALVHGTRPS